MKLREFIQLVREFMYDRSKITVSAKDRNKIISDIEKLKEIAEKEGFNLNEIIEKAKETVNVQLSPYFSNPLTDELSEAMLNHFIETGEMEVRHSKTKSFRPRGSNEFGIERYGEFEEECMKKGLAIIIKNIEEGNFSFLNKIEYAKWRYTITSKKEIIKNYILSGKIDEEISDFIKDIHDKCYNFGDLIYSPVKYNKNGSYNSYRIYMNMPINRETLSFIRDYIIKCQELGIGYTMKPFYNVWNKEAADTTIMYSSYETINTRIEIIKDLMKKYPNMQLGTPPIACSRMYGIDKVGMCNDGQKSNQNGEMKAGDTYNDYINNLAYCALWEVFGEKFVAEMGEYRDSFNEFKNREKRNLYGLCICPPARKLGEKGTKIVENCLLENKHETIKKFREAIQQYHNLYNGFAFNSNSNIAMNMWYIEEERIKHLGYEIGNLASKSPVHSDSTHSGEGGR